MNLLAALTVACLVVLTVKLPIAQGQSCGGKCVPQKNCQRQMTDEDDPIPEVDLRVGQEDSDVVGDCPHYLDVCCPPGMEIDVKTTDHTGSQGETSFNPCGGRNINGVGFRIGAGKVEEAEFGEFPWTLLILELQQLFDGEEKEVYACVGSLLAPNVALTVAHCVVQKSPKTLIVRAGEWDTRSESEVLSYQVICFIKLSHPCPFVISSHHPTNAGR